MSQDLFAAFGTHEPAVSTPQPSLQASHSYGLSNAANTYDHDQSGLDVHNDKISGTEPEDDDDFGDFEDAPQDPVQPSPATVDHFKATVKRTEPTSNLPFKPKPKPASTERVEKPVGRHPFAEHMDVLFSGGDDDYDAGQDEWNDLSNDPEAAVAYSKRIFAAQIAEQQRSAAVSKPKAVQNTTPVIEQRQPNKLKKKSGYVPARDPHVLFDAENLSESENDQEDDWGNFEEVSLPASTNLHRQTISASQAAKPAAKQTAKQAAKELPPIDLLGLNDDIQPSHSQGRDPGLDKETIDRERVDNEDDSWADFETAEPVPPPTIQYHDTDSITTSLPISTANIVAKSHSKAPLLTPTNIPPPAILLSIFPSLIASAQEALLDTLAKLSTEQKGELLAHPATQQFLKDYIGIATVLGHIIAGRRHRWKRDQHLAQSMRIGPSAAGGKGGMKLAGVDRSETAKEDREVLDTIRLWKAQVGKVRSAVTGANAAIPGGSNKLPPVPEIAEQMPIRSLKAMEGGITAPMSCALCGLKREERVAKVDVDVDDSFGEWWIQGTNMHLLCRNFWDEHSTRLRSR